LFCTIEERNAFSVVSAILVNHDDQGNSSTLFEQQHRQFGGLLLIRKRCYYQIEEKVLGLKLPVFSARDAILW